MATTSTKTMRMAMVGIGVGGAEILPAMESTPGIELFAGADINPTTRERFKQRYPNARVYDSIESLCEDPDVDAVWVSSPNRFHGPHAIYAANHGKHVVSEKPLALSMKEAEQMVEAAQKNNVKLMAGHTMAYSLPIRAMRRIIASGKLGQLRALHVWAYTDWMLRPRSGEELDPEQGGGIPYRQHPHQVDTVRVLGGGKIRSVRGMTGHWHKERPIPGYYSAYMEFEDGTPCTILHNGYGYFMGEELVPWSTGQQRYSIDERVAIRKDMVEGRRDEEGDKQDMRIGGAAEQRIFRERTGPQPWSPGDLGMVVASLDRGDIRHSKFGLLVYDDDGLHDVDLGAGEGGIRGRRAELLEFYDAVVLGKPLFHDGVWGIGTLEVGLAIMESAKTRKEITLSHQVAVSPEYDADLKVPYLDK